MYSEDKHRTSEVTGWPEQQAHAIAQSSWPSPRPGRWMLQATATIGSLILAITVVGFVVVASGGYGGGFRHINYLFSADGAWLLITYLAATGSLYAIGTGLFIAHRVRYRNLVSTTAAAAPAAVPDRRGSYLRAVGWCFTIANPALTLCALFFTVFGWLVLSVICGESPYQCGIADRF